jgi:hypothetical protein
MSATDVSHSNYSRWDKVDWESLLKDDDKATQQSEKREQEKARKRKRERAEWERVATESSERAEIYRAQAGVAAILARKQPPQVKLLNPEERTRFCQASRAKATVLREAATTHSTCAARFNEALTGSNEACRALRASTTSQPERAGAVSRLEDAATQIAQLLTLLPEQRDGDDQTAATDTDAQQHHHGHSHNNGGHCCSGGNDKHEHNHHHGHHDDDDDERKESDSKHGPVKPNDALAKLNQPLDELLAPARQLQDQIAVALANAHIEDGRALDAAYVLRDVLIRTRGCEDAWIARALAFFCMDAPLLAELHLIQPQVNVAAKFPRSLLAKIRTRVRRRQGMSIHDQVLEIARTTRLPGLDGGLGSDPNTTSDATAATEGSGGGGLVALHTADHLLEMTMVLLDESFFHSANIKALAAGWLALHALPTTATTLAIPETHVDQLDHAFAQRAIDTLVHALVAAVECLIRRKSNHLKAVRLCNWVLSLHPTGTNMPRALACRGLAREALGHYKLAIEDLTLALKHACTDDTPVTICSNALRERGRTLNDDAVNVVRHESQVERDTRFVDKVKKDLRRVRFVLKQVGQVGSTPVVPCAGLCGANGAPWYAWDNTVVDAVSEARRASASLSCASSITLDLAPNVRPNVILLVSLNATSTAPFAHLPNELGHERTVTLAHHFNSSGNPHESLASLLMSSSEHDSGDTTDKSRHGGLSALLQGLQDSGYCGGLFGDSAHKWPTGVRQACEQAQFDVSQCTTNHPSASFMAWFRQQIGDMRETRTRRPFFAIVAVNDCDERVPAVDSHAWAAGSVQCAARELVLELRRFGNVFKHTVVAAVGLHSHSKLVLSSRAFQTTIAKSLAVKDTARTTTSPSVTPPPTPAPTPVLVTKGEDVLPALVRMCTVPAGHQGSTDSNACPDRRNLADILCGTACHGVASNVVATSLYTTIPSGHCGGEVDGVDASGAGEAMHVAVGAFARAPLNEDEIADALDGAGAPVHVYQLQQWHCVDSQPTAGEPDQVGRRQSRLVDISEDPTGKHDLSSLTQSNVILFEIQRRLEEVLMQRLAAESDDNYAHKHSATETHQQPSRGEQGLPSNGTAASGRWTWPGKALAGAAAAAAIGLGTTLVSSSTDAT